MAKPVWRTAGMSLMVREDAAVRARPSAKIAGFDLNDTLVTSSAGAPGYQVTVDDWQYYNAKVRPKLRELHKKGFKLVIFTNQGNIRSAVHGKRANEVRAYIDALIEDLDVPVQVFASTQRDKYRKPSAGMWDFLRDEGNCGVPIDMSASVYVGDAAGRPGEHSDDDLKFAQEIGVRFVHTRTFFGASPRNVAKRPAMELATPERPAKVQKALSGLAGTEEKEDEGWRARPAKERLMPLMVLVLVGAPGSGKSSFAGRLGPAFPLQGLPSVSVQKKPSGAEGGAAEGGGGGAWRRICQDILGSREACHEAARLCLRQGQSVIIDRTNYDREQRMTWTFLAHGAGAFCHCLVFDVPVEECCRRVAKRKAHEGKVFGPGAGSQYVVRRLFSMLKAVTAIEAFMRVRVVRTNADFEREIKVYGGASGGKPAVVPKAFKPVLRRPSAFRPPAKVVKLLKRPASGSPR